MSVAQLEYFVAVAEEQHLTRAANRLHISQPPLTRQIKRLEEEVGAQLFERTVRGMRLLPPGEILLGEARAILGRIRALPNLVAAAPHPRTLSTCETCVPASLEARGSSPKR